MEGDKRGYVIASNGRVIGVAESAESAQRYALWRCLDRSYMGARFRWSRTHKLMAQPLEADHWSFTGIEIIPAPYV